MCDKDISAYGLEYSAPRIVYADCGTDNMCKSCPFLLSPWSAAGCHATDPNGSCSVVRQLVKVMGQLGACIGSRSDRPSRLCASIVSAVSSEANRFDMCASSVDVLNVPSPSCVDARVAVIMFPEAVVNNPRDGFFRVCPAVMVPALIRGQGVA